MECHGRADTAPNAQNLNARFGWANPRRGSPSAPISHRATTGMSDYAIHEICSTIKEILSGAAVVVVIVIFLNGMAGGNDE